MNTVRPRSLKEKVLCLHMGAEGVGKTVLVLAIAFGELEAQLHSPGHICLFRVRSLSY